MFGRGRAPAPVPDRVLQAERDHQAGVTSARVMREVLLRHGAAALTVADPGPLLLHEGEVVHLQAVLVYSRRHFDGLSECHGPVPVTVTTHRIVAWLAMGPWIFDWDMMQTLVCDPYTGAVEVSFVETEPLHLSGPGAAPVAVYATARLRGRPALAHDPTLDALLGPL